MTIINKLNNTEKIKNYILNFGNIPFTSKQVAEETEVPMKTVQNVLRKLQKAGTIKVSYIDRRCNFYIKKKAETRHPLSLQDDNINRGDFLRQRSQNAVLDILDSNPNITIREMVEQLNIGDVTIRKWTKQMLEDGLITRDKRDRYTFEYKIKR